MAVEVINCVEVGGVTTPAPTPDEPAVEPVLGGLRSLAEGIDRYRQALGAELGLGISEIITLTQLGVDEPMRASAVAARTGLTQGSVTALLDRLERHGYTRRVRPPENRRVVHVELTDDGHRLVHRMFSPVLPLLGAAATEPGSPGPDQLAHCLHRIAGLLLELADTTRTESGHDRPRGTHTP